MLVKVHSAGQCIAVWIAWPLARLGKLKALAPTKNALLLNRMV